MERRRFLQSVASAPVAAALGSAGVAGLGVAGVSAAAPKSVKPRRLAAGQTVRLVSPATATFETVSAQIAKESLEALGLKVTFGDHLLDRHGYLAGADKDRASDINKAFADPSVDAVVAIRGGWGSARLLPYLDFDVIAAHPKLLMGYSDITALHMAIQAKTGLTTFHGPIGASGWNRFTVDYLKRVLFGAEAVTFENLHEIRDSLTQIDYRTQTITPGKAQGRLLGGNLTVLTAILGSSYVPDFSGAILFLEDVGETLYRIDRMFTQLDLAGVLKKVSGVVFGLCTDCKPEEGYGGLTLEEILTEHLKPLGVPAYFGAMIGHRTPQFTLGEGVSVEIETTAGTIRMLEPAVV